MEISTHVICIGNEIVRGYINNTNAQHISKTLSCIGIKPTCHIAIPDDPQAIIRSIRKSLGDANIVILTGGLGPTVDDLTLECISSALDRKLILSNMVANHIRRHFKNRRLKMPRNNLRQALIPEGAKPILNNIGTAPGLIIPIGKKILIALPGVPFELYPMLESAILPYLKKTFRPNKIIRSRLVRITGLPESKVNAKIEDILSIKKNGVEMGIYPHPEEITVRITVSGRNKNEIDSTIKKIEKRIGSRLKNYIFGYDDEKLEEIVGKMLQKTQKTLSIAESCTGGLLADRITDVPGSSKYFKIGTILYSNEAKNQILRIPLKIVKKYGAVSRQVAILMAKNIRLLSKTDLGIGITGIAGPSGATGKKPVGLVYIAASSNEKTICKQFHFLGQRHIIKYKATQAALNMIRQF